MAAGVNPIALSVGIGRSRRRGIRALLASATPVSSKTGIAQVATVISRDEQIGDLVAKR